MSRHKKTSKNTDLISQQKQSKKVSNWFGTSFIAQDFSRQAKSAFVAAIVTTLSFGAYSMSGTFVDGYNYWRLDAAAEMIKARGYMRAGFSAFKAGNGILGHTRYSQAAVKYHRLAENGVADAAFELGKLTCVGWGVKKNEARAGLYFRTAKMQPHQRARILEVDIFRKCLAAKS